MSSARITLYLLSLALPPAVLAQGAARTIEFGASLERLVQRDDNASRSIHSGVLPGIRFAYQSRAARSRVHAGFEVGGGELTGSHAGEQAFTSGSFAYGYLRRVSDRVFAGAEMNGEGVLLEHRYAIGFSEQFVTSVVALRPGIVVQVPRIRNTELRAAATLGAMIQRPYSRSKAGTFGDAALVGPDRWRDVTVGIERSAAVERRYAWRLGYQLRARSYAATNGYAAVHNTVYVSSALRIGRLP